MNEKIPFQYDEKNKFRLHATHDVMTMEMVKQKIAEQAKAKGWSVDPVWLMFSWAKEIFEIVQTFEHAGKCEVWLTERQRNLLIEKLHSSKQTCDTTSEYNELTEIQRMLEGKSTDLETNLAKEFGDSEYFKAQTMTALAPSINLDAAVKCVYDNNEVNAKKTYLAGKIEEK